MTILPVVAVSGLVLLIAFFTYGRLLKRWLGVDPSRKTPAVEMEDGVDFVPAPAPVVLGGHFTAIAAAGPIVGPILAGQAFGWLPAILWIVLGAVFIGGVHDAGSLLASMRHGATSITQVVRQHMSRRAYLTFLIFVWVTLLYVMIAFADVTATSFSKFESFNMLIDGESQTFHVNGGAVAIGATAYLLASVVLGVLLRFTKLPWWAGLGSLVVLMSVCIWYAPGIAQWLAAHGLRFMDTAHSEVGALTTRWDQALLVYCFFASVLPMWLLLQPRGLIGATFLYATLAFGIVGTLWGGLVSGGESLKIQWPAITGFTGSNGALLFPFLFITIACGACSGFHSIVSSGTTCKQIRSEKDVLPVAYGAMLMEGMVAVFALSCVMVLSKDATGGGTPDAIYARGIGNFMNILGIPMRFAVGFGLLAFSSFVFDTLDVCTRLGRYVFQELTGLKGIAGGVVATVATLALPSVYLWITPPGAFRTFWTIFGTSNQLLAALTLVGVSVWLRRTGRPVWYALLPAVFMLASTGTALVLNFQAFLTQYRLVQTTTTAINMGVAVVLFALAALVVMEAIRVWTKGRAERVSGLPASI
jgi:carbon starvation protein